jgi:hypothetical protein
MQECFRATDKHRRNTENADKHTGPNNAERKGAEICGGSRVPSGDFGGRPPVNHEALPYPNLSAFTDRVCVRASCRRAVVFLV